MRIKNKAFIIFVVLFCLNFNLYNLSFAILATESENKYPDYAYEFLGRDKFENFNRKVFIFNSKLNKYAIRPIHIVWASVMPKYGMDRIQSAYTNIEFPKRLVSCLVQKDFKASGKETLRFITNTTLGLGGLYDPAKKYFKIEPVSEDMEQALAKMKVKQGPYLVIPVISSSSVRGLAGRILDTSLEPSLYLGMPVVALAKAGLVVNKTSYMQPLVKMIESTYADPYDIAKKLYGIENYIKNSNLDRQAILETTIKIHEEELVDNNFDVVNIANENNTDNNITQEKVALNDVMVENEYTDNIVLKNIIPNNLEADMILSDYNPQNPVTDSMRTVFFDLPGVDDSIWAELSVWNRCFSKKIKTSSVNIDPERENYKYKYLLQKNKTSPVAIIYPSIGEGISSHHSVVLAKLFYDEGYSVIIQGSPFHWEFVKSMPKDYRPGMPSQDADYLKTVTSKILNSLQMKYNYEPREKVVIGTSFGALTTLFLADKEYKNNTMNITKYISINPPIELLFALKQIDKHNEEWNKNPADIKHRTAITAAKIVQTAQQFKNLPENPAQVNNIAVTESSRKRQIKNQQTEIYNKKLESLPFSEDEAKLITSFIMRQKLSDLIFVIENVSKSNKTSIYKEINNTSYKDYAEKYLLKDEYKLFENLDFDASLHSIADFLKNNSNYKVYHTLNDYFVNPQQLKQLKEYSGNKVVLINNGSHLGFLYRKEFIDELKKDISLK